MIVQRFAGNPKLWGIVLTALGATFFLNAFFNLRGLMRGILPVVLIGFGIYLLRDFVFKPKEQKSDWTDFDSPMNQPTFAAAFAENNYQPNDFDASDDFATENRVPTWKNGVLNFV